MTDLPDISGLTAKERAFVEGLMAGKGDLEAYRAAGYSQNSSPAIQAIKASKLKKKDKIRVITLQFHRVSAEKAGLTLDSHLEKLSELRDLAVLDKQWAPAIRAEEARGHVAGHRVERIRQEPEPRVADAFQVMIEEIESTLGPDAARQYAKEKGVEWLPARDTDDSIKDKSA